MVTFFRHIYFLFLLLGSFFLSACSGAAGGGGASLFGNDGPIDIPAPVAKSISGVDASSLVFTPSGSPGLASPLSSLTRLATSSAGTLSGNLIDCSFEQTVILGLDGEVHDQQDTSCDFSFEIDTSLFDRELVLQTMGQGAETGRGSYPVIVTISSEGELTVSITNMALLLSDQPIVAPSGTMVAAYQEANGQKGLFATHIQGGAPEVLGSTYLSSLLYVPIDHEEFVFGLTEEGRVCRIAVADGTTLCDELDWGRVANAHFIISESGLIGLEIESSVVPGGRAIGLMNISDLSESFVIEDPAEGEVALSIELSFNNSDSIYGIAHIIGDDYRIYEFSKFSYQNWSQSEVTELTGVDFELTNPQAFDFTDLQGLTVHQRDGVLFTCSDSLCFYDYERDRMGTLVTDAADNISCSVIESVSQAVRDEFGFAGYSACDARVSGDYGPDTEMFLVTLKQTGYTPLGNGFKGRAFNAGDVPVVFYLGYDSQEALQLKFKNLNEAFNNTVLVSRSWHDPSSLSDFINVYENNGTPVQVARNNLGEAIMTWPQSDGVVSQIYKSEYRDGAWTDPSGLSDNISPDGQNALNPQVAMDDNGHAIIVWAQNDGTTNQIFKAEYQNGAWTLPSDLTDNISPDGQNALNPQVAMDNDGNTLIAWVQQDAGMEWHVFKAESWDGVWTVPSSLNDSISPDGGDAALPQVAMDHDEGALIVWYQSDGANQQIFKSQRFKLEGWSHPSGLNDNISPDGENAVNPQVAMDSEFNALIVWQQRDGADLQIFKSEYRGDGWTHPSGLSDNISPDGQGTFNPQVAMDNNGNALIVWSQSDGSNAQIFKSQYEEGTGWTHPSGLSDNISPDGQNAVEPQVAMDDNEDALIAWQQSDGSNSQIFRSEYRDGTWTHPSGLSDNISPDGQNASFPQVAMDSLGNALIGWYQLVNGPTDTGVFRSDYR